MDVSVGAIEKPGEIVKLSCRDFITFSYVELHPGPNLNLILGPNGTGKSSLVAAIILGLGGKPQNVGRGAKLSDYVKNGCQLATVEISLRNARGGLDIITCQITVESKTTWAINNKKVAFKDVQNLTKTYNIHVDNLCQMLPQEKVQMFARLNKQELFVQTLMAIDRCDVIEEQKQLSKFQGDQDELKKNLNNIEVKLQRLNEENNLLKGKVTNYRQKKEFLEQVKQLERKQLWLAYDYVKKIIDDYNLEKATFDATYKEALKKLEDCKKETGQKRKAVDLLKKETTNAEEKARQTKSNFSKVCEKISNLENDFQKIENDKKVQLHAIREDQKDVKTNELKLQSLLNEKEKLVSDFGDAEKVKLELQKSQEKISFFNTHIVQGEQKKMKMENTKRTKVNEIRCLENELRSLMNARDRKLEKLRSINPKAYKATLWLRDHKSGFRGQVFEPMILDIDVVNPDHAIYLENTLPKRDLVAFLCTDVEDMNKLLDVFEDKLKIKVNCVHFEDETTNYEPPNINNLRQYGFFSFLSQMFTAPKLIKNYLCRTYNLHNIPVGTQRTFDCYDQVPLHIKLFYTDKFRFSTKTSTYSNQRITSQQQIKRNQLLSVTVNNNRINEINRELGEYRDEINKNEEEINSINEKLQSLNQKMQSHQNEIKQVRSSRDNLKALERRIEQLRDHIESLKNNLRDSNRIERQATEKITKLMGQLKNLQTQIPVLHKEYTNFMLEANKKQVLNFANLKKIAELEEQEHQFKNNTDEAKRVIDELNTKINEEKTKEKKALKEAKNLSGGFLREDNGFDKFRESYESLPDDFNQLNQRKDNLNARIQALTSANDEEIEKFDQQLLQINQLEQKLVSSRNEFRTNCEEIENRRQQFIEKVELIIEKINGKFEEFFSRLNCQGQISLFVAEDVYNFDLYGVKISVSYREGVPLQELNPVTQSGGERAVATAIYLLSLQELSFVPFRCVDEINQGMDPENERRIFNLLAELSISQNSPQYFFVTPKLVRKLQYPRSVMVHVVHNGPFVCPQLQYNQHKGVK